MSGLYWMYWSGLLISHGILNKFNPKIWEWKNLAGPFHQNSRKSALWQKKCFRERMPFFIPFKTPKEEGCSRVKVYRFGIIPMVFISHPLAIWSCAFSPCAGLAGLPDEFWRDVTNVIFADCTKAAWINMWMGSCWLGCCFLFSGPSPTNLGTLYIYIYGIIAH